jgi:hypothetical protein
MLIFITFFVVSCHDETTTTTSGLVKIDTESLSIEVPTNWVVIDDKENILPKAKNSNIELAVASESIVNGFSNNLLILSDDLSIYTTSKDFSMLNNI